MVRPVGGVDSMVESLAERFQHWCGQMPRVFRAPGRVNLIGEHTDYNDGFVMPAAIDFYTWVAGARRDDRGLRVYSVHFDENVELSPDALEGPPRKHWSDYVRGVAAVMQADGHSLVGANLMIHGQVPLGAGLSSSASLELATALALMSLSGFELPALDLVRLCRRAEHEYVGTRCGIMDQFIAAFGRSGNALLLDCRSLDFNLLPIPAYVRLAICNTMVRHELAASEYNRRRADCETGVSILGKRLSNVLALRDVSLGELEKHRKALSDLVYRRCRHVISENQRVLDAAEALKSGNLDRFGQAMYASHASLREDYQVSCRELDLLVELASACDGVYGARMTGGGFGGCTVNLLRSDSVEFFQRYIVQAYEKETGRPPEVYVCSVAQGASVA
ncbi:MAG TPA: galactokinase [Terriglobales bacterium]|nr:galactokinase [Terriglobales bacterium]